MDKHLRISQGSVVTVLRRGGQNFKHLQQVYPERCNQILLKSVDMSELFRK